MSLRVRNWERFQHYRDRKPPWVKFYLDCLDDYEILSLPEAAQAQLFKLWLLAGRLDNELPGDEKWLAKAIHAGSRSYIPLLIERGFLERSASRVASRPLAKSERVAIPRARPRGRGEAETEKEAETETTVEPSGSTSVAITRARNEQWDGLEDVFGYRPVGPEAKEWGQHATRLREMGATRDSITAAAARYRRSMPQVEMTPRALVKHYQRLMAGEAIPAAALSVAKVLSAAQLPPEEAA